MSYKTIFKKHNACFEAKDFIKSIENKTVTEAWQLCSVRKYQVWFLSHHPKYNWIWDGAYFIPSLKDLEETLSIMKED